MKKTILTLVLTALFVTVFALPVFANAAEPPCLLPCG